MRKVTLLLVATFCYVVVGLVTPVLAGAAAASRGWRLVAWLLSLAIFAFHVATSSRDHELSVPAGALNVALAVALAAFVLAAVGPVRSHWSDVHRGRVVLLSLVAWPLLAGLPAFFGALLAGHVIKRRSTAKSP